MHKTKTLPIGPETIDLKEGSSLISLDHFAIRKGGKILAKVLSSLLLSLWGFMTALLNIYKAGIIEKVPTANGRNIA